MRIGLVLPLEHEASDGSPPWAIAVAERAEAMGLDSVWAYDHFFSNSPDESPRMPVHEAWTIVSAVAARTSRVEIGQLVTCTAHRPPGLLPQLARMVQIGIRMCHAQHERVKFRQVDDTLAPVGPRHFADAVPVAGRHWLRHLHDT